MDGIKGKKIKIKKETMKTKIKNLKIQLKHTDEI